MFNPRLCWTSNHFVPVVPLHSTEDDTDQMMTAAVHSHINEFSPMPETVLDTAVSDIDPMTIAPPSPYINCSIWLRSDNEWLHHQIKQVQVVNENVMDAPGDEIPRLLQPHKGGIRMFYQGYAYVIVIVISKLLKPIAETVRFENNEILYDLAPHNQYFYN